jgi:hypothetical protein
MKNSKQRELKGDSPQLLPVYVVVDVYGFAFAVASEFFNIFSWHAVP